MKKNLLIATISSMTLIANAQTNVSGGLFANTTWTLVNSPYIVTANVVLFPGFTLTIQPGVTVKFDAGVQLEIRQSSLIALGTAVDSITFTSNTSSTPGSWDEIILNGGTMTSKFSYCKFNYANKGLFDSRGGAGDTLVIKHSNFIHNTTGLDGSGTSYGIIDTCNFRNNTSYGGYDICSATINKCDFSYNQTGFHCHSVDNLINCTISHNQTGMSNLRTTTIDHCTVNSNQSGISMSNYGVLVKNSTIDSNTVVGISMGGDWSKAIYCQIKNNLVGIDDQNGVSSMPHTIRKNIIENNSTGINLSDNTDSIFCNKICNNTSYDLYYTGTNNVLVANNYWCTVDSTSTQAVIYDGHNNISYGLVNFMPLDNLQCYLLSGILNNENEIISFNIFPNPATDHLTIQLPENISKASLKIFNMIGELEYFSNIIGEKSTLDVSGLANGLYLIQVSSGNKISSQKFIKE